MSIELVERNDSISINNPVLVVDGAIDSESFSKLSLALTAAPYKAWRIDDKKLHKLAGDVPCDYLQFELDVEDFKNHSLYPTFKKIAQEICSCEDVWLERGFCNAFQYGDATFTHRDERKSGKGISMLCFLNTEWDSNWGGELLFFDEEYEAKITVSPKPGRVVAFMNDTLHRPGLPHRTCPEMRVTLNLRFCWNEA